MGGRQKHQGHYRQKVSRKEEVSRKGGWANQKAQKSKRNWGIEESRDQRGWVPRESRA